MQKEMRKIVCATARLYSFQFMRRDFDAYKIVILLLVFRVKIENINIFKCIF